jgi:hypothetical protein
MAKLPTLQTRTANERARCLPIYIYAVHTWGQLTAVAEPPSGFGRILIIASAGVEPPARAPQSHHLCWGGHRLRRP